MADNPKKKKADGKRTSKQDHEQRYREKKANLKAGGSSKMVKEIKKSPGVTARRP